MKDLIRQILKEDYDGGITREADRIFVNDFLKGFRKLQEDTINKLESLKDNPSIDSYDIDYINTGINRLHRIREKHMFDLVNKGRTNTDY